MGVILSEDFLKVKRVPERAVSDRDQLFQILDAGKIIHIGFVDDNHPVVIPLAYVRDGERILLHGSTGSRLFRTLAAGAQLCGTVTLLDGIVAARSAFNSSMNYRSVMIFGKATLLSDENKDEALEKFTNNLIPERWQEVRKMTNKEKAATIVLSVPLETISGKVRVGGPADEEDSDLELPIWAGHIPIISVYGEPIAAENLSDDIDVPQSIKNMK